MNGFDYFLVRFLISVGIGILIGLEREQHRDHELVIAGVRTFPLISMAGFISGYLSVIWESALIYIVGFVIFGAISIAYFVVRHTLKMTGITSPIAMLITFLIGILVSQDKITEAVAVGVTTTVLLFAKKRLHALAMTISHSEMMSALQFLILACILYPMTFNPIYIGDFNIYSIINLQWVMLTIIVISVISFISFLIIKYLGSATGMTLSGFLGGLINSEATTVTLANYVRSTNKAMALGVVGVLMANASMLIRNLIIATISDPSFTTSIYLSLPLLVMSLVGLLTAFHKHKRIKERRFRMKIESPFEVKNALFFGVVITLISLISYTSINYLGDFAGSGVVYLTAIGGFVSSAAVTFSVVTLAYTGHISPLIAAETAFIASVISTFNKIILTRTRSQDMASSMTIYIFVKIVVGIACMLAVEYAVRL